MIWRRWNRAHYGHGTINGSPFSVLILPTLLRPSFRISWSVKCKTKDFRSIGRNPTDQSIYFPFPFFFFVSSYLSVHLFPYCEDSLPCKKSTYAPSLRLGFPDSLTTGPVDVSFRPTQIQHTKTRVIIISKARAHY